MQQNVEAVNTLKYLHFHFTNPRTVA